MSGFDKSENLKQRIEVICTKQIIPIQISENNYDVDPSTIREIAFEEVQKREPTAPIFKGEQESTVVASEPELYKRPGVSRVVPAPFPLILEAKEELNTNNNVIIPVLGFAVVASAIYAFK